MPFATVYTDQGRCLNSFSYDEEHDLTEFGENLLEGQWDGNEYYVLDGVIKPRPPNPCVITLPHIMDIPLPARLILNGTVYDLDEPDVELDVILPGPYHLRIESWPYRDVVMDFVI